MKFTLVQSQDSLSSLRLKTHFSGWSKWLKVFKSTRGSLITRLVDLQYITSETVLFLSIDPSISKMDAETDLFQLMLLPAPSSSPIFVLSARSRQIKNLYGAMFAFSEGAGVEKKKKKQPSQTTCEFRNYRGKSHNVRVKGSKHECGSLR